MSRFHAWSICSPLPKKFKALCWIIHSLIAYSIIQSLRCRGSLIHSHNRKHFKTILTWRRIFLKCLPNETGTRTHASSIYNCPAVSHPNNTLIHVPWHQGQEAALSMNDNSCWFVSRWHARLKITVHAISVCNWKMYAGFFENSESLYSIRRSRSYQYRYCIGVWIVSVWMSSSMVD